MPRAVFGTAHLFGVVAPASSTEVLEAAYGAGFRSFDTAPSYGYGRSEPAVGLLRSGRADPAVVTTKVGIIAQPVPGRMTRTAKALARRLPSSVQDRLRGDGVPAGHGAFDADQVAASVQRSLGRLGRIDRLLLHEVTPVDITDELLTRLVGYVEAGDVGALGVATANRHTGACLERGRGVFTVAHVAVGPLAAPAAVAGVTTLVGHGALGPAAADLQALQQVLDRDETLDAEWRAVGSADGWDPRTQLADVLLARAAASGCTDLIVATSQVGRLPALRAAVDEARPLTRRMSAVLEALTGRVHAGTSHPTS